MERGAGWLYLCFQLHALSMEPTSRSFNLWMYDARVPSHAWVTRLAVRAEALSRTRKEIEFRSDYMRVRDDNDKMRD